MAEDTVLAFHCWIGYAYKVSTGEQLCRFELPKGFLAALEMAGGWNLSN